MYSSRTMFLEIFLAILTFTQALVIEVRSKDCDRDPPSLPSTGTDTNLPTTNLTLSYIALGRGIQNYTCPSTSSPSSPLNATAIGAIATLYDVTSLAYSPSTLALLHTLPGITVYSPPLPSITITPSSKKLQLAAGSFKVLGNHYFDAAGTPTFNLSAVKKVLYAAKTGDVKAPVDANPGPAGTGAVDWLQLAVKTGYAASVRLKLVYRVVTAGGVAPLCTQAGEVSVQYAAEYWFFD